MKKYKVEFERIETGYCEIFADNAEDAIKRLYNQHSYNEVVETIDFEYTNPTIIRKNKNRLKTFSGKNIKDCDVI